MAVDISFNKVTDGSVTGIGYFDILMKSIKNHIDLEYQAGRLKGADYATVYTNALQIAIQQSQQFVLAEQLTEAQIDGIIQDNILKEKQLLLADKDLALKAKQLELEEYRLLYIVPAELAQLQKQIDVAERGMAEQELTGIKQRILLDTQEEAEQFNVDFILPKELAVKDAQITGMTKDNEVKTEQVLMSTYERTFIQPKQLEKVDSEIASIIKNTDVAERSMIEQELTGVKQRILLETQEEAEQFKVDFILPKELDIATKDIEVKSAQIVGMTKDNEVKTEQVLMSTYERTFIQPKQLEKVDSEIASIIKNVDVSERSMVEQELTGIKQRDILEVDKLSKTYEKDVLLIDQHNSNIKQQEQVVESTKVTQTQKVKLDKETALLGLDDVALNARQTQNGTTVYSVAYTQ